VFKTFYYNFLWFECRCKCSACFHEIIDKFQKLFKFFKGSKPALKQFHAESRLWTKKTFRKARLVHKQYFSFSIYVFPKKIWSSFISIISNQIFPKQYYSTGGSYFQPQMTPWIFLFLRWFSQFPVSLKFHFFTPTIIQFTKFVQSLWGEKYLIPLFHEYYTSCGNTTLLRDCWVSTVYS
jgi:hypothetical protein